MTGLDRARAEAEARLASTLDRDQDRQLHDAVHGALARRASRAAGTPSLDEARRDRRARAAGTLGDVRALEADVLAMNRGRR